MMTKALAALRNAVELVPSHAKAQSNLTGLKGCLQMALIMRYEQM